jgi:hypothetical protein
MGLGGGSSNSPSTIVLRVATIIDLAGDGEQRPIIGARERRRSRRGGLVHGRKVCGPAGSGQPAVLSEPEGNAGLSLFCSSLTIRGPDPFTTACPRRPSWASSEVGPLGTSTLQQNDANEAPHCRIGACAVYPKPSARGRVSPDIRRARCS